MRLAAVAVSLLSSIALVPATLAQSQDEPAPAPTAAPPSPPAATPSAPSPSPTQPPSATAPSPTPQEAAPAPPEAPPPPPPAPTDPGAIRLLSTLESVCIPAAHGQDPGGLAKAAGYRKSGDNYVLKQAGYQFTILPQGSNPNQCHVDILGPVDPESPAKPLVVALHNWAVLSHDWTLYRNDKNVSGASEFTTRSWENSANGQSEGLVLTTIRKADGSPSQRGGDTSEMIYSVTKSAS
jgi:hypothetical protein